MRKLLLRAPIFAPMILLAACNTGATDSASLDVTAPDAASAAKSRKIQSGSASWYQMGWRTANGEAFQPDGMTAAHRTLPFGTRVRVVDEKSGRSVVVRINDRGPFTGGRVIDLARGPAKALGMIGQGVSYVSLHQVIE
jgi:rare lipoprotein A